MDIYVHAAKLEPFGFVIAEAMFNKKPIITTRVGASRDVLVHKESAYLINYNAPSEIAEGVEYFLSNPHKELIEKAYLLAVKNFSRENMWNCYKALFLS
jgi:glycosyltransferase involved in cell wall biosynthesis